MNEQAKNLNQALLAAMERCRGETCFQIKKGRSRYQDVTYREFEDLVFNFATFLHRQSVPPQARIALVANNSLEWMAIHIACLLAGAVAIPLRTSVTSEMLLTILQDTDTWLVILQDETHIKNAATALNPEASSHLPGLKHLLVMKETPQTPPEAISVEALLATNTRLTTEAREQVRAEALAVEPDSPALIIHVTGESGRAKGAAFDQGQLFASLQQIAQWFTFDEDDSAFTLRPWCEIASLLVTLHYFISGIPNALIERYETVTQDMQLASPTVMLTTPYIFERTYEEIMDGVAQMPESTQEVFQWALAKGKEYHAAGDEASPELRQEYNRADMTFFSRIRGQLGGRIRRFYSAGASLSQELVEFYEAIGLFIYNVYSLTEAGGFPAASQAHTRRAGSCGQVVPGFEMRIADDGEILVRGETVMRHYWQHPEETRQALDPDGWLHSGDEGYFDDEGYLFITGRKQHLLVLSTGRKIVPTTIENALTNSPFITQAAVVGEGKPYISAMILPDLDALAQHFEEHGSDDDEPVTTTTHPQVKELLDQVIGQVNNKLDRWEQVREYSLLDQPLTAGAGELTASMKISRHVVAERYSAQIDSMYPVTIQMGDKKVTQVQTDPERLRELLEKESILDAWMEDAGIEFLFELAREKHIDAPSMVHICDAAAAIAQLESEEKPLSTAIIVGDPARIARILPGSQVQLLQHDHIRRMRKTLVTLAKIVDGLVLGYLVDNYGYVRGVHKLNIELDEQPASYLLGPQFRRHAAISQKCEAVVFFVPTGGRQVRTFANGQLIGRYSNGDWSPEDMGHVEEVMAAVAQEKDYDLALLKRVLRCAFQMSEENLGAIFVIGNANEVLKYSDEPETSHFAMILGTDMDNLTDRELINFAQQDGATIIDAGGKFRGCMVLLRPDANIAAEIGPGKGARHSSAAKMSAQVDCLAITVSQDGPITGYASGRRILSL